VIGLIVADEICNNLIALLVGVERVPHPRRGRFEVSRLAPTSGHHGHKIALATAPLEAVSKTAEAGEKRQRRKETRM